MVSKKNNKYQINQEGVYTRIKKKTRALTVITNKVSSLDLQICKRGLSLDLGIKSRRCLDHNNREGVFNRITIMEA